LQDLGNELSYILDGGPCSFGVESTILSLLDEEKPTLLRHGPIIKEALESFLQKPIIDGTNTDAHLSPGLYKKHYSPQKPLYWVQQLEGFNPPEAYQKDFHVNAAHVFLYPPKHTLAAHEYVLSPNKSLEEVATHLFECLQQLDKEHWSSIWIEKAPDYGIGKAINDRLSRAAHINLTI
jgi:L-threonylcarbamoyladenylate synthase